MKQLTHEQIEARMNYIHKMVSEKGEAAASNSVLPMPVRWNIDEKWIEYTYHVDPVTQNSAGIMHGGMLATLFDNSMGYLANSFYENFSPTVNLSVSFLKAIQLNSDLIVKANLVHTGKNLIHVSASAAEVSNPDDLCATATGIFYVTGSQIHVVE